MNLSFMNFFEQNSYIIVLVISLIVWLGMYVYMAKIDKKISRLEKQNK